MHYYDFIFVGLEYIKAMDLIVYDKAYDRAYTIKFTYVKSYLIDH